MGSVSLNAWEWLMKYEWLTRNSSRSHDRKSSSRTSAPGTQAEFGALVKAWIDSGAHCPPE